MVDDPFDARPQDGRSLDPEFLSRALDAVLRLAEIYAAERRIQIHGDAAHLADPLRAAAQADLIPPTDAPTASSPNSLPLAEPLGRAEQSGWPGSPRAPERPGQNDAAMKIRRGGWTKAKGNSTSAQIRAGAVEYLREKGARASGREIWEALKAEGLVITTKDPVALVSSRIGRSPLFDHTYEGYGLVEWSKGAHRDEIAQRE
jgi:hypothetical protein